MEQLTNFARSTLSSGISNVDTSLTLVDGSTFPTKYFHIIVEPNGGNKEIIFVESRSGNVLTLATRGAKGTTAIAHAGGVQVVHTALAHNYQAHVDRTTDVNPDITAIRKGSDEFDNDSLDSAWVRVDRSGNSAGTTWTEKNDVLSVRHNTADLSAEMHAIVKPIDGSLSAPITIETKVTIWSSAHSNNFMYGLVFSNNPNYGSGIQITSMPWINGTAGTLQANSRAFSGWGTETNNYGGATNSTLINPLYQRLRWNGDNTFECWFSPDGVSWMRVPNLVNSLTMTPTHFGLWISHWGGTKDSIAAFDYFRVY